MMFRRSKKKALTFSFLGISTLSAAAASYFLYVAPTTVATEPDEFAEAVIENQQQQDDLLAERITEHSVGRNSSLAQALNSAGFQATEIHDIVRAAKTVKDLNRIPSNLAFRVHWIDHPETVATQIDFQFTQTQSLRLKRSGFEDWKAELIDLPITKTVETFAGVVKNSLWDSAVVAGMDPQLIIGLSTVFAWQVDFNREVQINDRWRIVVEKLFVKGKHIGWGNILAAEYKNSGDLHTAVRYPQEGPNGSYYAPDGSSLKRMFLKSPLNFGRISSRFKPARFHPILKRSMPHNGVDYAAPIGTPVMSVGKGTVELAGSNGGSGIMIKVRHNSMYTTAYLHLSRIAKGISRGAKVEQGQLIGYVGATGLATGPHLHFAFYENSVFVDPLGRKFPSADPVPEQEMIDFQDFVSRMIKFLPAWSVAEEFKKPSPTET